MLGRCRAPPPLRLLSFGAGARAAANDPQDLDGVVRSYDPQWVGTEGGAEEVSFRARARASGGPRQGEGVRAGPGRAGSEAGQEVTGDDVQRADEVIGMQGKSKADQDGQGSIANAFVTDDELCPVRLLRQAHLLNPQHFAQRRNYLLTRRDGRVVSGKDLIDALRKGGARRGVPEKALSAISLRAGGASAMWHAGCSVDEIKRRGRWASECWRVYIWSGRERARDLAARMLGTTFTLMASLARYARAAA